MPQGYRRGLTPGDMTVLRALIQQADATQLTIAMSLIFTQIREGGYTLSAPIESVLLGQPPAWRILDHRRQIIGTVAWQNGEWTTETRK